MTASTELSEIERERIEGWITKGICKGLRWNGKGELTEYEHACTDATGHEQFLESSVVTDLRSQVWGRLYTNIKPNSRLAYSYGMSAGRDYVRASRKTLVVSQMELTAVGEDANDGESARNSDENPNVELLMPWDRVDLTHYEDPQVEQTISECENNDRWDALRWLQEERPADYKFLIDFGTRKVNHSGNYLDDAIPGPQHTPAYEETFTRCIRTATGCPKKSP